MILPLAKSRSCCRVTQKEKPNRQDSELRRLFCRSAIVQWYRAGQAITDRNAPATKGDIQEVRLMILVALVALGIVGIVTVVCVTAIDHKLDHLQPSAMPSGK